MSMMLSAALLLQPRAFNPMTEKISAVYQFFFFHKAGKGIINSVGLVSLIIDLFRRSFL